MRGLSHTHTHGRTHCCRPHAGEYFVYHIRWRGTAIVVEYIPSEMQRCRRGGVIEWQKTVNEVGISGTIPLAHTYEDICLCLGAPAASCMLVFHGLLSRSLPLNCRHLYSFAAVWLNTVYYINVHANCSQFCFVFLILGIWLALHVTNTDETLITSFLPILFSSMMCCLEIRNHAR